MSFYTQISVDLIPHQKNKLLLLLHLQQKVSITENYTETKCKEQLSLWCPDPTKNVLNTTPASQVQGTLLKSKWEDC